MRKVFGLALITAPFVGLAGFAVALGGWALLGTVVATTIGIALPIYVGTYLLAKK